MLPEALPFRCRAVLALVLLHDRELRRFFSAWRDAEWAGVALPPPYVGPYASPAALLRHVLGAARGYMVWMTLRSGTSATSSSRTGRIRSGV
jgi:hypothetical protein